MTNPLHVFNGAAVKCPILDEHLRAIMETHENMQKLATSAPGLIGSVNDIRDYLLASATGRNHIDKETFKETLRTTNENAATNLKNFHRVYGVIIMVLLFSLAFCITGQKLGLVLPWKP